MNFFTILDCPTNFKKFLKILNVFIALYSHSLNKMLEIFVNKNEHFFQFMR